jgi:lipopolysaccharide export system protein LptA
MVLQRFLTAIVVAAALASGALAQGTQVAFGGLRQDTSLPVEISADQLEINQAEGIVLFSGNVLIGQGEMRLSAARVRAEYITPEGEETGRISKIYASGGVTLVNGAEAAEAKEAVYSIDEGIVIMTGEVILTQGRNALAADRMVVNLREGIANLEGRVRTIIFTGAGGN